MAATGVVRLWDTATGAALPGTLVGHNTEIVALAVAEVGGRPVVAAVGTDGTLRRWDLATHDPIGDPVQAGPPAPLQYLRLARLNRGDVFVAGSVFGQEQVIDAATGARIGGPPPEDPYRPPSVLELNARVVELDPGYLDVTVRDLESGAVLSQLHSGAADARTAFAVGGRGVLAMSHGSTIELQDLLTGAPLGPPLTGHEADISDLVAVTDNGKPLLLSAGLDRSVRVWDLSTRLPK